MNLKEQIPLDWQVLLKEEFAKEYFISLSEKLVEEYKEKTIYPPKNKLFNALSLSPLDKTKIIILGQDPYHNENQANGLAFSVNKGIKLPPSLRNIYKELNTDLNIEIPFHGELTKWAKQGVLLINAIFSVEAHKPSSHKKLGWQNFTDSLITRLSEQKNNLVFILWGNFAQSKAILIDTQKHLIIKSAHPSPLSAYNGFWDSKPYSKANEYLQKTNQQKINWEIPIF